MISCIDPAKQRNLNNVEFKHSLRIQEFTLGIGCLGNGVPTSCACLCWHHPVLLKYLSWKNAYRHAYDACYLKKKGTCVPIMHPIALFLTASSSSSSSLLSQSRYHRVLLHTLLSALPIIRISRYTTGTIRRTTLKLLWPPPTTFLPPHPSRFQIGFGNHLHLSPAC